MWHTMAKSILKHCLSSFFLHKKTIQVMLLHKNDVSRVSFLKTTKKLKDRCCDSPFDSHLTVWQYRAAALQSWLVHHVSCSGDTLWCWVTRDAVARCHHHKSSHICRVPLKRLFLPRSVDEEKFLSVIRLSCLRQGQSRKKN